MQQVKILLVQLASNGDCLLVTTIARQIKEVDYPGCHLTWLIGSKCTQVIENNPYVDETIEIPFRMEDRLIERYKIAEHIENAGGSKKFDKIFVTDYTRENYKNWFGTTRSSLFRNYPHPLKISPQPIIFLTENEKNNVADFCNKNKIGNSTYNVLFECAPQSGQSKMSFSRAMKIAEQVTTQYPNIKFILSSNQSFVSDQSNIIDGSAISWRENAELANYCQLLVGCSSGISWLCTSNWTKPIHFIQIINPGYFAGRISASMKLDFRFFGISTEKLIELNNPTDDLVKKCITATEGGTFEVEKKKYDITIYSSFFNYKFLKESQVPAGEKFWYRLGYLFGVFLILNIYRAIKRTFFKLSIFFKRVLSFLKRKLELLAI